MFVVVIWFGKNEILFILSTIILNIFTVSSIILNKFGHERFFVNVLKASGNVFLVFVIECEHSNIF